MLRVMTLTNERLLKAYAEACGLARGLMARGGQKSLLGPTTCWWNSNEGTPTNHPLGEFSMWFPLRVSFRRLDPLAELYPFGGRPLGDSAMSFKWLDAFLLGIHVQQTLKNHSLLGPKVRFPRRDVFREHLGHPMKRQHGSRSAGPLPCLGNTRQQMGIGHDSITLVRKPLPQKW